MAVALLLNIDPRVPTVHLMHLEGRGAHIVDVRRF